MRHYEIVILVHPDQSEQVGAMVDRYRALIEKSSGSLHRLEDWGRRQLAYPINKIHKAHYVLMNVECDQPTVDEMKRLFRFNDAVIRSLVMRRDAAVTEKSPLLVEKEKEQSQAASSAPASGSRATAKETAKGDAPAKQTTAEETPVAEQPVAEAKPNTEEQSAAEAKSGTEEPPAAEAKSKTEDKPTAEEKPSTEDNTAAPTPVAEATSPAAATEETNP